MGDVFLALTALFAALVFLAPLMRRPAPQKPGAAGGH